MMRHKESMIVTDKASSESGYKSNTPDSVNEEGHFDHKVPAISIGILQGDISPENH